MARRAITAGPREPNKIPRLGPDPKQVKALAQVTGRFTSFKPASSVLLEVEAVPTCFLQFNRVSKVGGWPIARFSLIHGPSNEGKTELVHGVGGSFLSRGHLYALVDAEQTTPMSWVRSLVGPNVDTPGFVALRPRSYEETVKAVREFCTTVAEAREKREIDESTTAFVVVDSLRKLVPKKFLDDLFKALDGDDDKPGKKTKDKGIDGAGGRAGQIKAMLNAAWLDELIVLLAQTRVGMAVISRETEVESENPFASGPTFKVGGGKAPYYDSSLVMRVLRDSFLYERKYEQGKPPPEIIGERRAIEVHKTKVAGRDERWPTAYYHTSNGRLCPVGFDPVRDVLELAQDMGIVDAGGGGWFSFDGSKLGQGLNNTLALLRQSPEVVEQITQTIAQHDEAAKQRQVEQTA
jgi:recombination protein RecA